jgi:hypothetical protein
MRLLSRSGVEKHWRNTANDFRSEYRAWTSVFWDLIAEVSAVLELLEGKKKLAENCSYLLLSKALNHALAMLSLAERGLCIDAALATRGAIETLLLLQLLLLDRSEALYRKWADGEELKPGWVRNELKTRSPSEVRNVVVTIGAEQHDMNRVVYRWLSDITHANLESLNQTVRETGDNSFEVYTGGTIYGKSKMLNALFAIICDGLHWTAITCVAVFNPPRLEKTSHKWSELEKRIKAGSRT